MFRNYFKTAFRNMMRNKLFTCLNILGLAAGIACSLLIFLWVQDERSFDRFNPNAKQIFRLTGQVKDIESAQVPPAFPGAIQSQLPMVKSATRIRPAQKIITVGALKYDEKNIYYADSNFLKIFSYPLVQGDAATVLLAPNSVVLTEKTAKKYFSSVKEAMGKTIFIDNDSTLLQVTGIVKNVPANSHLQFDMLMPIAIADKEVKASNAWRFFNNYVYIELTGPSQPGPETLQLLEKQVNAIRNKAIANTPAVPAVISLQPLSDIHLYSHFTQDVDGQGNIEYVKIFSIVALFIIIIACINFMNLATAMSGNRATEVGLRKTIGALRSQLTAQFIIESTLLSFFATLVALTIVYMVLPLFNTLNAKSITLNLLDIGLLGKILGITLLVGLLAGSYPAFYISSFNVIKALKGAQLLKKKDSFLRNGLVVLQFTISIVLMISTVIIYNQLNFIRHKDIGFNKENLLYVSMPEVGNLKNNADALKFSMMQTAGMGDFTFTSDLPVNLNVGSPLSWRGMNNDLLVISHRLDVDELFLKTFGIQLLKGRFFSRDFKGNDSGFVINETAVKAMQLDAATAIGKMITIRGQEGPVVGVIKDFNFKPLHQNIEPLILRNRSAGSFMVIRTASGNVQGTLASLENCFKKVYGNIPFAYGFVDQDLDRLYKDEKRMGSLFNVFAALSIIISCLGLFGLATFVTQKRTKEIGVRKVLGAGETGIVLLLSKEFLKLVAVSLLIAFPIAWYVMYQWLQDFIYRTNISIWVFVIAGISALMLAFITVSYQTIKAAITNPVISLKVK